MNTLQIQNYMKKICHSLEFNVFAANRIPIHVTTPFYMISNLDPDTKPGSHWVAICVNADGNGEYFDTFGRKPNGYHLTFLRRNTNCYIYNNKPIQSVFSSVCGEYCLLFLYFKLRGMCSRDFVTMFSENSIKNDVLLRLMFNSYIM